MVDFHRHFSPENPVSSHEGIFMWFATASMNEWSSYGTDRASMHGYGHLPSQSDQSPLFSLDHLKSALAADPLAYIGEVGDEPMFPFEQQMAQLKKILEIARELSRPAVIHHRGSISPVVPLLTSFSSDIPIIIHQYSGSVETARELYSKGIYISISPAVREKQMKLARRIGELDIPFLIETDYTGNDEETYLSILTHHYEWISRETSVPLLTLVEKQHEQSSILTDRTSFRL